MSSAHIYLRLPDGQSWDDIPADLLNDCVQLTKANSIEGLSPPKLKIAPRFSAPPRLGLGNKKDNVNVVYTPWSNLKKDGSMVTGQVGFKDPRCVRRILVGTRTNAVINRLNKTRTEAFPDLLEQKEERLRALRAIAKKNALQRQKEEERVARERRERAWQRDHAYDEVFTEDALEASSNHGRSADYFDDFM